nr:hypothetical protein [uncultured Gellertiella sp.]
MKYNRLGLGAVLATSAALLSGFIGQVGSLSDTLASMPILKRGYRAKLDAGMKASSRRKKTGVEYPFSSKGQQERNARQLAAGKLDFSASRFHRLGAA